MLHFRVMIALLWSFYPQYTLPKNALTPHMKLGLKYLKCAHIILPHRSLHRGPVALFLVLNSAPCVGRVSVSAQALDGILTNTLQHFIMLHRTKHALLKHKITC